MMQFSCVYYEQINYAEQQVRQAVLARWNLPAHKVFISKYLTHIKSNDTPEEKENLFTLMWHLGKIDGSNRAALTRMLPIILNNTLKDCPLKFTHLCQIKETLANIGCIETIFPFLSYQELVSIETNKKYKAIFNDSYNYFNSYPLSLIPAFAQSPTKLDDVLSLIYIFSEREGYSFIHKIICEPDEINDYEIVLKRYAPKLIEMFNYMQKMLLNVRDSLSENIEFHELETYPFVSVVDLFKLFLDDGKSFDALMHIINAANQGPFLVEEVYPKNYAHTTQCKVNHYKGYLLSMAFHKDYFKKLITSAELLDKFNSSLIKHILIYALSMLNEVGFFDNNVENLSELALWFNKLGSEVVNTIITNHDSQIKEYIIDIQEHDDASDDCNDVFGVIIKMFDMLWEKLKRIIINPKLLQVLHTIQEINIVDILLYKFNLSQLDVLASITSAQPTLPNLSLLAVLVHPDMLKYMVLHNFETLQQKAEEIFSAYANLQKVVLHPMSISSQPALISANNPHAMFAKRPSPESSPIIKITEISTKDLKAELERRGQLTKQTDELNEPMLKKKQVMSG